MRGLARGPGVGGNLGGQETSIPPGQVRATPPASVPHSLESHLTVVGERLVFASQGNVDKDTNE